MRAYSSADEEAMFTRALLSDWAGQGFITRAHKQRMEQDAVCDLRRTNIFLRVVLFLFSLIIVVAGAGLLYTVFLSHADGRTAGIVGVILAAVLYAAAELAVSQARLHRHGIEEALVVCSIGFLYTGLGVTLFRNGIFSATADGAKCIVPAAAAALSLCIWHRFGLAYAFLAAMIFAAGVPGYWTPSHAAQRLILAAMYAAGLLAIVAVRSSNRVEYLKERYALVEALLWLGMYLSLNLQLWPISMLGNLWGGTRTSSEFAGTFYWTTWILIWCLPTAVLYRGISRKDRFVLAAGAITAILTLVTNKPYLGWERHTWDPMLLGAVLIGLALLIRRWLARGPGGIRHGFTAQRLSERDKRWMNAGSLALGFVAPHTATHAPQETPEVRFGGGDSGGGGASSDF